MPTLNPKPLNPKPNTLPGLASLNLVSFGHAGCRSSTGGQTCLGDGEAISQMVAVLTDFSCQHEAEACCLVRAIQQMEVSENWAPRCILPDMTSLVTRTSKRDPTFSNSKATFEAAQTKMVSGNKFCRQGV